MKPKLILIIFATGFFAALVFIGVLLFREEPDVAASRAEVQRLRDELSSVRAKLAEAEARATAADGDNALLLEAIAKTGSSPAPKVTTRTSDMATVNSLNAEILKARSLMQEGDHEAALKKLLDIFRRGADVPLFLGVRTTTVLYQLAALAKAYPPAHDALQAICTEAQADMSQDPKSALLFAAASRYLKQEDTAIRIMDELAPDDTRRRLIALGMFNALVERHRYADALTGRSYSSMVTTFDASISRMAVRQGSPMEVQAARQQAIDSALVSFEVLAAAATPTQALTMAEKILAFESSPQIRERLQFAATKVGKPELLTSLRPKS